MTVQFSPELKKNLIIFVDFFKDEDSYHGTSLVQEFHLDLKSTIEMTKEFSDAFPEFVPRVRRISLKKFKNHCIRYNYDTSNGTLTFLTIKHYSEST